MLIHVTQYNAVQDQVAEQVKWELEYLQQRLRRGDGASPGGITGAGEPQTLQNWPDMGRPHFGQCMNGGSIPPGSGGYAISSFTTRPCTSVRRKSRPA